MSEKPTDTMIAFTSVWKELEIWLTIALGGPVLALLFAFALIWWPMLRTPELRRQRELWQRLSEARAPRNVRPVDAMAASKLWPAQWELWLVQHCKHRADIERQRLDEEFRSFYPLFHIPHARTAS